MCYGRLTVANATIPLISNAFSDRGQIDLDRNTEGFQDIRAADTREFKDLWAVDGTANSTILLSIALGSNDLS